MKSNGKHDYFVEKKIYLLNYCFGRGKLWMNKVYNDVELATGWSSELDKGEIRREN